MTEHQSTQVAEFLQLQQQILDTLPPSPEGQIVTTTIRIVDDRDRSGCSINLDSDGRWSVFASQLAAPLHGENETVLPRLLAHVAELDGRMLSYPDKNKGQTFEQFRDEQMTYVTNNYDVLLELLLNKMRAVLSRRQSRS